VPIPTTTGSQESPLRFQIAMLVSVDDNEPTPSPETLRRLGHRVAEALELAAELLAALEPRGWRSRLSAEGGYVAAWLEKTARRQTAYADIRALPQALYTRLLEYLPILAKHDSDIEELRPTESGFEPYQPDAPKQS